MAVTSARPPQLKTAPTFASLVVPPGTDVGAARKLLERAQHGCLIANPLSAAARVVAAFRGHSGTSSLAETWRAWHALASTRATDRLQTLESPGLQHDASDRSTRATCRFPAPCAFPLVGASMHQQKSRQEVQTGDGP